MLKLCANGTITHTTPKDSFTLVITSYYLNQGNKMRAWHKNSVLTEKLYSCISSLCRCAQNIPETVSEFVISKICNPSSVILY